MLKVIIKGKKTSEAMNSLEYVVYRIKFVGKGLTTKYYIGRTSQFYIRYKQHCSEKDPIRKRLSVFIDKHTLRELEADGYEFAEVEIIHHGVGDSDCHIYESRAIQNAALSVLELQGIKVEEGEKLSSYKPYFEEVILNRNGFDVKY